MTFEAQALSWTFFDSQTARARQQSDENKCMFIFFLFRSCQGKRNNRYYHQTYNQVDHKKYEYLNSQVRHRGTSFYSKYSFTISMIITVLVIFINGELLDIGNAKLNV